jgi:hypothetical protein
VTHVDDRTIPSAGFGFARHEIPDHCGRLALFFAQNVVPGRSMQSDKKDNAAFAFGASSISTASRRTTCSRGAPGRRGLRTARVHRGRLRQIPYARRGGHLGGLLAPHSRQQSRARNECVARQERGHDGEDSDGVGRNAAATFREVVVSARLLIFAALVLVPAIASADLVGR